jgi:hypothetical protein
MLHRRNSAERFRADIVRLLPPMRYCVRVLSDGNREFDMRLGKYLLTAAAATMAVAPVSAAAVNPAASLSVSQSARAGSATAQDSEAVGGGILIAILAAAAVIAGIIIVADSDDDPDSP